MLLAFHYHNMESSPALKLYRSPNCKKGTSLCAGKMKQKEAVSNKPQWHIDTDNEYWTPENGKFCVQKH